MVRKSWDTRLITAQDFSSKTFNTGSIAISYRAKIKPLQALLSDTQHLDSAVKQNKNEIDHSMAE